MKVGTALAVVVLASALAAGCGSSSKSGSRGASNTTTSTSAASNTTLPPKETTCTQPCADSSGWIVEVSNFNYDVASGNEFITPESGNVFVTMNVKFVNNSKSPQSASSFDFKLRSAGVERTIDFVGPCEQWSSVDVAAGASYGPKCLSFQAAAGKSTGIVLVWKPGLVKSYDIPLEGASRGATAGAETGTTTTTANTGGGTAASLNYCSPGLSATQGISCELAGNVFYEYFKAVQNGRETTALSAWSPETKQYYTANCTKAGGLITCYISGTSVPNAQVEITQAAVDDYTPAAASEYARTHDVGPRG